MRSCEGCGTQVPESGPPVCRPCWERYTPRLQIVEREPEPTREEELTKLVTLLNWVPDAPEPTTQERPN